MKIKAFMVAVALSAIVSCSENVSNNKTEHLLPKSTGNVVAAIKNQKVTGEVRKTKFILEKAILENGILTLRQGKGFFADVSVQVFTHDNNGVEGKTFSSSAIAGQIKPQINLSIKDKKINFPDSIMLFSDYELILNFGKKENMGIPFAIKLTSKKHGTHVEGKAFATYKDAKIVKGDIDVHLDSFDTLKQLAAEYISKHNNQLKLGKSFGARYTNHGDDKRKSGFVSYKATTNSGKELLIKIQLLKDDNGWRVVNQLGGNQIHSAQPVLTDIEGSERISPQAHADFLDDRPYSNSNLGLGDLFPPIRRLYIGKDSTRKCLGTTVSQCVERIGQPSNSETISENEMLVKFYGKKNLYLGTGADNKSIGPEWREMRVVNGKIVEEHSFVQIIEHGYSWNDQPYNPDNLRRGSGKKRYRTELFGKYNVLVRVGLTPVEPVPKLPEISKVTKNYTEDEKLSYYFRLLLLDNCSALSKDLDFKASRIQNKWSKTIPGLIDILKSGPEYLAASNPARIDTQKLTTKQIIDFKTQCENSFKNLTTYLDGVDPKFSSPKKTWTLYLDSLKNGDRETIFQCLTDKAKKRLSSYYNGNNLSQLKLIGNSFKEFQLSSRFGRYQPATTSRSNGKTWKIMFYLETTGNWKIKEIYSTELAK